MSISWLFSYKASAEGVHMVFAPIRWYYRWARFVFGAEYQPFVEVKEGLHPIPRFYKTYQGEIRLLVKSTRYWLTAALALVIYRIVRSIGKK